MCRDYSIPNGIFRIGQEVKVLNPVKGWFDYSSRREIPVGTIGYIFKIEKMNYDLDDLEYMVKFENEFDYVKISHKDLINV